MSTQNRYYSNTAAVSSISNTAGLNASETDLILSTTSGWPTSFPFAVLLEPGTTNMEVVLITSGAGSSSTPYVMTRGYDGTTGIVHGTGKTVQHTFIELDLAEPQEHLNLGSSSLPHGIPSTAWVGGSIQLIQNFTLVSNAASINFSSIPATFNHLYLTWSAQTNGTATADYEPIAFTWNGAVTSYNWLNMEAHVGASSMTVNSASSAAASIPTNIWNSHAGTAGQGSGWLWCPFYANSLFYPVFFGQSMATDGGAIGDFTLRVVGNNTSTAAVSSIVISPSGAGSTATAFTTGSMFSLYGMM